MRRTAKKLKLNNTLETIFYNPLEGRIIPRLSKVRRSLLSFVIRYFGGPDLEPRSVYDGAVPAASTSTHEDQNVAGILGATANDFVVSLAFRPLSDP